MILVAEDPYSVVIYQDHEKRGVTPPVGAAGNYATLRTHRQISRNVRSRGVRTGVGIRTERAGMPGQNGRGDRDGTGARPKR